jgi:hypothetical protein
MFDGTAWMTVRTWSRGRHFQDKQAQHETVLITNTAVAFSQDMRLRFRCDGSDDEDDVYIDTVRVTAQ